MYALRFDVKFLMVAFFVTAAISTQTGCSPCAKQSRTLLGTNYGGGSAKVQLDESGEAKPVMLSVEGADVASDESAPATGAWSYVDINGNGTFGVTTDTPTDAQVWWAGSPLALQVTFNHAAIGAGEKPVQTTRLDIRPADGVLEGFTQATLTVVDDTNASLRVESATFGCMGDTGAVDTGLGCDPAGGTPVTIEMEWSLDATVQADVTMLSPGCL
ncbi:MAG: hypothetical protein GXP62_01760 [Oligoflexia bacterium]|nr:hypothetical protein [Oligoflexia bacterium]